MCFKLQIAIALWCAGLKAHSNLIIYKSLNGMWCLSPPKTNMLPCESTTAEWPSLAVGFFPETIPKLDSLD